MSTSRNALPQDAIVIDDDDGETSDSGSSDFLSRFVDLTADDEEHEVEITKVQARQQPVPSTPTKLRNGPITAPFKKVEEQIRRSNLRLAPGKAVELQDGTFIRIEVVFKNEDTDDIFIRGAQFRRNKTFGGLLKRDLNEVTLAREIDLDDDRPAHIQAMVDAPLAEVKKNRNIKMTTLNFPMLSFRTEGTQLNWSLPGYEQHKRTIADTDVLICRYVYTEYYANGSARHAQHQKKIKKKIEKGEIKQCPEGELRRVREEEDDKINATRNVMTTPRKTRSTVTETQTANLANKKTLKTTYGSGCVGAGGDAHGAHQAGLQVKYGWDRDESALKSFLQNHPAAVAYLREALKFPASDEDATVDILHLSWPCQFFSAAHTTQGLGDEENSIALFNTADKLKTSSARIHTQENTAGLFTHHPAFFTALVQMILRAGHNIRWKVVRFWDYGLPASRTRLIVHTAKIGTPLPKFPPATHGPGLLPYRSVADAISRIPTNATWHLKAHQNYNPPKPYEIPRPPYNAHENFARCVMKSSGIAHPSGLRPMTPRELACIQGFPINYQFHGASRTQVNGQIGNAVPPLAWKYFAASCKKAKEDWDRGLIDEAGEPIPRAERLAVREERRRGSETESSRARAQGQESSCERTFRASAEDRLPLGMILDHGVAESSRRRPLPVQSRSLSLEVIQSIEIPPSALQLDRLRRTNTASPLKRKFVDLTIDD